MQAENILNTQINLQENNFANKRPPGFVGVILGVWYVYRDCRPSVCISYSLSALCDVNYKQAHNDRYPQLIPKKM